MSFQSATDSVYKSGFISFSPQPMSENQLRSQLTRNLLKIKYLIYFSYLKLLILSVILGKNRPEMTEDAKHYP